MIFLFTQFLNVRSAFATSLMNYHMFSNILSRPPLCQQSVLSQIVLFFGPVRAFSSPSAQTASASGTLGTANHPCLYPLLGAGILHERPNCKCSSKEECLPVHNSGNEHSMDQAMLVLSRLTRIQGQRLYPCDFGTLQRVCSLALMSRGGQLGFW